MPAIGWAPHAGHRMPARGCPGGVGAESRSVIDLNASGERRGLAVSGPDDRERSVLPPIARQVQRSLVGSVSELPDNAHRGVGPFG